MIYKGEYKYTGSHGGGQEQPAEKKTKLGANEGPRPAASAPASSGSPGTPSAPPPPQTPMVAAPSGSVPTGAASSVVVWGGAPSQMAAAGVDSDDEISSECGSEATTAAEAADGTPCDGGCKRTYLRDRVI